MPPLVPTDVHASLNFTMVTTRGAPAVCTGDHIDDPIFCTDDESVCVSQCLLECSQNAECGYVSVKRGTEEVRCWLKAHSQCNAVRFLPDGWFSFERSDALRRKMRRYCRGEDTSIPPSQWDTSRETNMDWLLVHTGCLDFDESVAAWNTANVVSMRGTFYGATRFDRPLQDWDTSRVTDMGSMFESALLFDQPLAGWRTSAVTNLRAMFLNARTFDQSLDGWDTSNVESTRAMFASATSFNGSIAAWDTSEVRSMYGMFAYATSFDQPLGEWDVSRVQDMSYMFYGASSFDQPGLDAWDTSSVASYEQMFEGASSYSFSTLF